MKKGTYTWNDGARLPGRKHGIESDEMQLLGLPLVLRLGGISVRDGGLGFPAAHDLVPRILDPLGQAIEVGLGAARALSHHADDAVRPRGVVCHGLPGQEIRRLVRLRPQVLEHHVHVQRRRQERRAVQPRDVLRDRLLLGRAQVVRVLDLRGVV